MLTTEKCNSCIHENVCNIRDDFKTISNKISPIIPENIIDFVSINISCKYYNPKIRKQDGIRC